MKKPADATATYYEQLPPGPSLDTVALDHILAGLEQPAPAAESLWAQFRDWLEQLFGGRTQAFAPEWFEDFRLSEDVALGVFYVACTVVVLLAVGIIANEIRHARAGRRQRNALETAGESNSATDPVPDQASTDIPLLELPAYLLDLLADRALKDSAGRTAGLTHRELEAAVTFHNLLPDGNHQATLSSLAALAEKIRYAPGTPPAGQIKAAIDDGRLLLTRLERAG